CCAIAVARRADGYRQLHGGPLRQIEDDRSEDALRSGQDLLWWWRMVHARPGLPAHREYSTRRRIYRLYLAGIRGQGRPRRGCPKEYRVVATYGRGLINEGPG